MRNMKQRMLALVCCLVLVVSGLYITEPKEASAAEASKISLSTDMRYFTIDTGDGKAGFLNIKYTSTGSLSAGTNVVQGGDYTWVSENITFGGGMTQEDFIDGLTTIYIANDSVFQINFGNRTKAFTEGWSFSIKQGALLPYNGSNAYVALDKEYEFTFGAGSGTESGYHNTVSVTAYNTTTFSMNTNPTSDLGNGLLGVKGNNLKFTLAENKKPDKAVYHNMITDSAYSGYIDFNGVDDNASLSETGLSVQYILETDGTTYVMQMVDWGDWKTTLTTGGYWAFKQGLPIYWTSGGENYKAVLDATYVYYVTGSNTDNTQTYRCFKFDSEANNYGLKPFDSQTTGTKADGYYITTPMHGSIASFTNRPNYVGQKLARKYYDFAGWTDDELTAYGVKLELTESNVFQLVLNGAGVNALEVGDTITLRDGLPIAYKTSDGAYVGATLQGNYMITVTAKTNTTDTSVTTGGDGRVTFSMKEIGTFGLTGSVSNATQEGSAKYQNIYLNTADFADASGTFNGNFDSATVIENYFYAERGGKAIDLTTEGWYFRYYYLTGSNQMVRYYCPENYATFTDGDYIIWRQGLPITYTTTKGTSKTVTLDKDYGFVWSAADGKFVYDKNLVYDDSVEVVPEEIKITYASVTFAIDSANNYNYINIGTDALSDYSKADTSFSIDADYIGKWMTLEGMEASDLTAKLRYGRHVTNNTIQFSYDMRDSGFPAGASFTWKKGAPLYYINTEDDSVCVTLDEDYIFRVVANSSTETQHQQLTVEKSYVPEYKGTVKINTIQTQFDISSSYDYINIGIDAVPDWSSRMEDEYGYFDADYEEAGYLVFRNDTSKSEYYHRLRQARLEAVGTIQFRYDTRETGFTTGSWFGLAKDMPIYYWDTNGGISYVVLDNNYVFTAGVAETGKASHNTISVTTTDTLEPEVEHTFTAKSGEKTTVWQDATSDYRLTLGLTISPENATSQWVNILADTASYPYIDICGIDLATLVENGVELLYIPHAKALQFDLTEDLSWMEVGDTITLKKGLPVTCKYNETTVTATLTDDITYTVTAASATSVTVDVLAEGAEYTLGTEEFGLNNSEAYGPTIKICDPASGEQTVLDDATKKYEELEEDIVAKYIDIAGMTAQDLAAHNVKFRWIKDGDTEVIQMQVGTLTDALAPGDRITFKAGLPITYTTTEGLKKTITLASDVVYQVNAGNNDYACTVYQTSEEVGEWDFEFGAVSVVEKNETEGYYNNIKLSDSCDMKREVTSVTYQFNAAQMKKYIDFAGLDVDTYGFQAYAIIDANNQVIQFRWGADTTSQIRDMDDAQITFKEGLPIYANVVQDGESVSKVYLLSRDVVFSIEEYTDGANGYRLNSVGEESKATPGDVDGDYLQNVNDVNLMRKHLAELINVSDTKALDANEDAAVNIKDLVRVKKAFGTIAEPEIYTSIYESCNLTSVAASATGKEVDDAKMTITFGDGKGVSLGTDTYLRLTYKTSQDLRGYFVYTVNSGSEVEEEFYLEAKASQFRQFLDVYRSNGINGDVTVSEIVLKRIELYNLSTTNSANVLLHEVEHAGRTVVTDNMVWAQTSDIKIGVDMNMGGSLAYMECLKYDVYEYLNTSSREVIIGTEEQYDSIASKIDCDTDGGVNLINIYDWGRQIQQSYYSYPSGSTNWEGTAFTPGEFGDSTDWPYNPVQAGDQYYNRSQIVDYRAIDTDGDEKNDFIYVKTRAMDWSKKNETTDSYMENWYRVEGALVYVENNYIDWSGFGRSTKLLTQELPALYVGQSFNTLVADANGADDIHTGLGIWTAEDRYHNNTTTTNWYAFVNKEATSQEDSSAFGVGIYIPNVDGTTAGRVVSTRGYRTLLGSDQKHNVNADDAPILNCGLSYINEMANNAVELGSIWGDVYVQNCFVSNASYIAPRCTGYMTGYKDYSYTYVLTADTLNNINASFTAIDESGEVTNESLGNW